MKKFSLILIGLTSQLFVLAQWDTDRILTIGRNAMYFEDYVLSIQYFNQIIRVKPYLAEPYLYRGISKIQLGDFKGADEDLSEAIERNPFLPNAYYARGFARQRLNFFKEATADFSKALEFNPDAQHLLLSRIESKERSDDYSGAMADLNYYTRLYPKDKSMLYEKGRIFLAQKDTLGAIKAFDELIKSDSTNSQGWSARALLRMQRNDYKGALNDYTKAISLNSTFAGDYINRGIINVENKNFRQALKDYDNAIKYDKSNVLAYLNRGLLRANLGDNNNALADLSEVMKLDSTNFEALLQKASLEITLGQYKSAIKDFKTILGKYNYFIPAYLGIAEAQQAIGNQKEAFRYRQLADNIEKNKDYINRKNKENLKRAANKIALATQKSSSNINLFNRFSEQVSPEENNSSTSEQAGNSLRGAVQNKYADIVNERNYTLTYYAKPDELRQTNTYYPLIDQYNKSKKTSTTLKLTNNELPLTAELINYHFDAINRISDSISANPENADLLFKRAIEFALVQDFNSAIEDLTKFLEIRPDFMPAYFCRANIRYKLVESQRNTPLDKTTDKEAKTVRDKQLIYETNLIIADFEKVNQLCPDFIFAYFNKANVLCTQKDFKTAILNYSKAIEIDKDFAEAYFNRGLTYLFIGEDSKGLSDLSKAGELGIFKAYNLLQRFKKQ